MGLVSRQFNGKLNFDVSPYKMSQSDYIDALNITRDAEGEGQDSVVSNINGNDLVSYSLPSGTNKKIGSRADPVRNRIYYWIWNSNGYNLWLYYDKTTDTITKLIEDLTDTDDIPVLDFDPSYKINHADIIYRDDEGDLVFWTDNHVTPKCANVQTIIDGTYTTIKSAFIELAKMPPLAPPTAEYGNDATKTGNALRRKLFQPAYRWEYDDFQKSTFSPYGKIPLPIGIYGSDNDLDSSNNNFITITVETGDENVSAIEIAVRSNIGNAWGDFVLVATLDKAELNIPDNSSYQFLFYNDALYPPITDGVQYVDGVQVVTLFDWVPKLCKGLILANGNIPVVSAITEGYDNYPVNELDVTMTVANVLNTPPDADPPSITYLQNSVQYTFTVSGNVPTGTLFRITAFQSSPYSTFTLAEYTSLPGDTTDDVAAGMYAYVVANNPTYAQLVMGNGFILNNIAGSSITTIYILPGAGSGISTEKTWLWEAQYIFGIVYQDEQNRDMPGVTTYSSPNDSDNDFVVNTPQFSESGGSPETPVISAEINHLPPAGAVKYNWVRRRQTFGTFMFYMTCDFQDDPDNDGHLYFCLANITAFKEANNQFIYTVPPIVPESRIKIIAGVTADSYNGDIWNEDYQILGTVSRTISGGVSPEDDRIFVKVTKPIASVSPAYSDNMVVMVYTPAANPTSLAESVYWEWGESYDIYELDGVMYHRGMDQDQTSVQPATFTFEEGDVYYRTRSMYQNLVGEPPYTDISTVSIMDANYSDYFDSAVNDNGRAHAIEVNAREQFNPVMVRFAGAYQSGTNINETNRFYFENFDEYDRRFGTIQKLFIEKRYMYVFQEFDIGVVPVLTQIVKDVAGNPLEANSDILLNKVMYPYQGQFGIGNVPESFAYGKGGMYGIDNNKGVVWRLSQKGVTPLSVLYECNAFFIPKLKYYKSDLNNGNAPQGGVYTGDPTCYGAFDSFTNKYIIQLEEINRYNSQGYLTFHQDPYTITFLESRGPSEGFESLCSYYSEGMDCLNNLFVSFKNGALWKHDSDTYCNFYGVQYNAYITGVFNDNVLEKKTWESMTEIANDVWECPVIYSNVSSYTGQRQETNLTPSDFTIFEENPIASILRDSYSIGGKYNGDWLKGNMIVIRFQKTNASDLVILSAVNVMYKDSPLTTK